MGRPPLRPADWDLVKEVLDSHRPDIAGNGSIHTARPPGGRVQVFLRLRGPGGISDKPKQRSITLYVGDDPELLARRRAYLREVRRHRRPEACWPEGARRILRMLRDLAWALPDARARMLIREVRACGGDFRAWAELAARLGPLLEHHAREVRPGRPRQDSSQDQSPAALPTGGSAGSPRQTEEDSQLLCACLLAAETPGQDRQAPSTPGGPCRATRPADSGVADVPAGGVAMGSSAPGP